MRIISGILFVLLVCILLVALAGARDFDHITPEQIKKIKDYEKKKEGEAD